MRLAKPAASSRFFCAAADEARESEASLAKHG
jgi:hypothetical protein